MDWGLSKPLGLLGSRERMTPGGTLAAGDSVRKYLVPQQACLAGFLARLRVTFTPQDLPMYMQAISDKELAQT